MKKQTILTILLVITLLLSGCGEVTLEEKIAQVREANTITTQDVIDLMELEGLEVNKLATDAKFKKNWPGAVLVQVNDTYYVALKSFEENLWERRSAMSKTGWQGGLGAEQDGVVSYIGHNYMGYEKDKWISSSEISGKNIVALAVPVFPKNISELTLDEQRAEIEKISADNAVLKRVFYEDINAIVHENIAIESENFTITGTLSYYAAGVTDEKAKKEWTYYDAHSWLNCEIVCSDALWEQYEGAEYLVEIERPDNWTNSHGAMSSSGIAEFDKTIDLPDCYTDDILWSAPEGKPIYAITITIGDISETFRLEPTAE